MLAINTVLSFTTTHREVWLYCTQPSCPKFGSVVPAGKATPARANSWRVSIDSPPWQVFWRTWSEQLLTPATRVLDGSPLLLGSNLSSSVRGLWASSLVQVLSHFPLSKLDLPVFCCHRVEDSVSCFNLRDLPIFAHFSKAPCSVHPLS